MNNCYPFVNTPLPYAFDALEPYIDAKTMELHHNRHLQTYIDNLNKIMEEYTVLQSLPLETMLCSLNRIPKPLQTSVANNAGGVFNHRFYFEAMNPNGGTLPDGRLRDAILDCFGSFEQFQAKLKEAAISVFGSGYAWLVLRRGQLRITTTANQNTPLIRGLVPLLNVDVWEHAYYLKHYNQRAAYLDDWFRTVDYTAVERRYNQAFMVKKASPFGL